MLKDEYADGKDLAKVRSEVGMPNLYVIHLGGQPAFFSDGGKVAEMCEAFGAVALQNPRTFIVQKGLMTVRISAKYQGNEVQLVMERYGKADHSGLMWAEDEFYVNKIPRDKFVKDLCDPGNPTLDCHRVYNAA